MATLRRMASLDCILHPGSNPASPSTTLLIRHSSLPNLFLCQPELAIGALNRLSSLNKCSLSINELRSSPCGDSRSPRGDSRTASKLPLVCRALSSSHFGDETPEFESPTGFHPSAQGRLPRSLSNVRRLCTPFFSNKKEGIVDLEKSVVYSEMRESACSWKIPPRFSKPYSDMGDKAFAERDTHMHTLEMRSQNISDLCMQKNSSGNDVGRPMSLRMLKRKLSKPSPPAGSVRPYKPKEPVGKNCGSEFASLCGAGRPESSYVVGVGDSVFSAFSSLVYMLKMLQQYALSLSMPSHAIGIDAVDQNWVDRAYAEMLDSFLWLFQQVFSCTPKLMLLTMMLLVDFAMHSVSKHLTVPVMPIGEPPPVTTLLYSAINSTNMGGIGTMSVSVDEEEKHYISKKKSGFEEGFFEQISPSEPGGEDGHGGSYSDGNGDSPPLRKMTLESKNTTGDGDEHVGAGISSSLSPLSSSFLKSSWLSHHVVDIRGIDLGATTKNMLVAPVRAPLLEADDYPCFDRTDLAYQQEISMDPGNPLLLTNYAQFLHVVRHDNGRAEQLYRRAVMVDAGGDGEVAGRFANFLWVVKGDVVEAESAYKAAVMADPSNVYHAGCYANFLWSSSASQGDETSCCSNMDDLGTT